jgi:hypothetical protein
MAYVYDYTGNLNSWDYIYNGLKDMSMMSHVMPADGWVETMNMCLATDDGSVTYKDVIYVGSERKFLSAERTMPGTVSAQLGEYSCTDHSVGKIAVSEGQTVRWGVICTGTTGWLAVVIDQVNGQNATERDSPTTNPPLDWGDTTLVYTYGGYSFVNGLEYHPNSVPSTPTQSSPSAGATGVSTTPTFQGVNVHPAADSDYDSTSQVQLQIRRVSDNVIVSDTTFTPSNQAAGGTWSKVSPVSLTGGISYEWRIRHADEFGEYSGFSGWRTFTTLTGPSTPVAVGPTGKINAINTFNYQYQYVHPTPLNANAFQVRVWNATGTTLLYTSPETSVSLANGATATLAEWHADLGWGTEYTHQARFRDTNNIWGGYSELTSFQTDAAPNAPTNLQPTGGVSTGSATLTCNVSDPDGDAVTLAQVEIVNVSTGAVLSGYPKSMTVDSVAGTATFNATADLTLGVQYKWRARANDNLGPGYGAYSGYSFFTYVAAPTVSLLSPTTTRQNIVNQPGAEHDPLDLTAFWTESARSGTNFVDRVVDSDVAWGEGAWQGTAAATGDNRFSTPFITIDATKPYSFQVMLKKISGTATTHFHIEAYNSSNVKQGSDIYPTSILTANATDVASSWTRYGGIVWQIGSGNTPAFPATTAKVKIVWTPSRTTAAVVRADAFFAGQVVQASSSADWLTLQPWYGYGDPDLGGYGIGGYTWTGAEGDSNSQNLSVLTAPAQNVLISYTGGSGAKNSDRLYVERWTGAVWAAHYDSGWQTTTRTLIPVPTNIFSSEARYRVKVEARDTALTVGSTSWSEIDVRFEGPPEPVIAGAFADTVNARISIQYSLTNSPTEIEFGGVELQRVSVGGTEDSQIVDVAMSIASTLVYDHYPLNNTTYLYRVRQVKQDGANRIQSRWATIEMSVDYSPFSFIKDAEDPFNLAQFETRVENVSAPEEDAPISSILAWGQTTFSHDVGLARLRSGEIAAEFFSDAGVYGVPDHLQRYDTLRKILTGVLSPGQRPSRRTICILQRYPDEERIFAMAVGPVAREFEPPVGSTKRLRFSYQETSWVEDWYVRNGWT